MANIKISGLTAGGAVATGTLFEAETSGGSSVKHTLEEIHVPYSATEQLTGKTWIDGKPIYRKVVNMGSMPNSTSKSVAHSIAGLTAVIEMRGHMYWSSVGWWPLPYVATTATDCVRVAVDTTNVIVQSGSDRSSWTGQVIIEYTK